MKKWYKTIITLACVGVFVLAALPIMSVEIVGGESYTAIVRGYNLMEFSPWGVIPLMTPLLIFLIVFGKQSRAVKEAELLLLLVISMICYVHSFQLATEWLRSVGTSMIARDVGMALYPSSLVGLLIFAHNWDKGELYGDVILIEEAG